MTDPKSMLSTIQVHGLDGAERRIAMRLFFDSTTLDGFVAGVEALGELKRTEGLSFDLHALRAGEWTLGYAALKKGTAGDARGVWALAKIGYNFALDSKALDGSETLWHGSLKGAVAEAANQRDPSIAVPSLEEVSQAQALEMKEPSFRGFGKISIRLGKQGGPG
jgi:hypothetical protein